MSKHEDLRHNLVIQCVSVINDLKACVLCSLSVFLILFPFLVRLTICHPSLSRSCLSSFCLTHLSQDAEGGSITLQLSVVHTSQSLLLNGHYSQVTEPFLTHCASKPSKQSAQGTGRSFAAAAAERALRNISPSRRERTR